MPLHICKKLFSSTTKEQLAGMRNANVQLKAHSRKTIAQLGIGKLKIEHNNKQKVFDFFVVLGSGQAQWDMPYTETLNILTINCNTMGT